MCGGDLTQFPAPMGHIRFPSLVSDTQPFHLGLGTLQDQHLPTILLWLDLTLRLEALDQMNQVAGMREKPSLI